MKEGNLGINASSDFRRFSSQAVITYLIIAGLYLSWLIFGIGEVRPDHVVFITGCSLIFFSNQTGRTLLYAFGFILIYWVIFDSIRLWPNYDYNTLHIAEPYLFDKNWFGIASAEGILTPNEYFKFHNNTFFDIYTALIYIAWIPIPLTFAFWLFFTKRRHLVVHFLFVFLLVSQVGLIIQYIYPAAPPWYVELYGFEEHLNIPGNPGRLINFDKFFGVNLFGGMYSLNANVYAAIPSLHCAFPIIQLYFARKHGFNRWAWGFTFLMFSTWFSAVYTNHHYILDVMAGIGTGLLAVLIYDQVVLRTRAGKWLNQYGQRVS